MPQLLQRLFSYTQKSTEDLVTCSLNLLELFDRIAEHDKTFKSDNKNVVLKERLAEAVLDEGLKRERRRLNTENQELSFFELRDRGDKWLSKSQKRATNMEEVKSHSLDMDQLKKDIVNEVVQALRPQLGRGSQSRNSPMNQPAPTTRSRRKCWECGSESPMKRDCEVWKQKVAAKKVATNQETDVMTISSGKFLDKARLESIMLSSSVY